MKSILTITAAGVLGIAAGIMEPNIYTIGNQAFGFTCVIKGNISKATGEKIYHMPQDKYYGQTSISWISGERYFCSEVEARDAGWRRSRV